MGDTSSMAGASPMGQDDNASVTALGAKAYAEGTQVVHNATELVGSVQALGQQIRQRLTGGVQGSPYVVLGAAAGAGFLLGRGLSWRMSRTLVMMGVRMAIGTAMRRAGEAATSRLA